ncbi:hypothetical protein SUGI_1107420 [Cryptomeria japonica]|uniref:uncharacterized protein LOC131046439 n=1 Tax=Cryptomeria japonica TaxID=3369 RepID=UPI0024149770|nr:uncharacterized protein LOC131046439 [Cryptomeria japonica]GLJ52071.1 hypothetical protein SUGI_1107420 [Cryptomeria japonica]
MDMKITNCISFTQCCIQLYPSANVQKKYHAPYPRASLPFGLSASQSFCQLPRCSISTTSSVSIRVSAPAIFRLLKPVQCRNKVTVRAGFAVGDTKTKNIEEESVEETGVVVVGAGLAGLAAGRQLAMQNIPFRILEASDGVGGRVRTDYFQGFLLDRGFQIFITAYPEAKRILNYESLDLKQFYSGALVYYNGSFHRVADPFKHFADSLGTLLNPIGTILDKILIGVARLKSVTVTNEEILLGKEVSIMEKLSVNGFSSSIIDRFFRPFFGGIFFDTELTTTSRLFDFVFKCLALGSNTLPAVGIKGIPEQIASQLPEGSILLNSRVEDIINDDTPIVRLEDGRKIRSKYSVVLAVEEPEAARLLGKELRSTPKPPRRTVCLYFSADEAPVKEPILILNGSGKGIVNNTFFATNVAPSYGPPGKTLVSVSLVGCHDESSDEDLRIAVVKELSGWFGSSDVASWKHLRTYRIRFAQPDQTPPTDLMKEPRFASGIYLCGDYRDSATFDGALVSGRRAIECLVKDANLSGVL